MLGDEDAAKDIVQETMITIWQKLHSIRTPETYKTWVYRIAINRCYDLMRKLKTSPEVHRDNKAWETISNHLADGSASELENEEIARVLDRLGKVKAVILLHRQGAQPVDLPASQVLP